MSRWLILASLVYLALGFTSGALLLFNKGVPIDPVVSRLLPAHAEFLLAGWVVQLAMGVAMWIFPRFGVQYSAYGSTAVAWLVFALLNAGIWLAGVGPVLGERAAATLPLVGRLAETAAAVLFAVNVWARVRASGLSEM